MGRKSKIKKQSYRKKDYGDDVLDVVKFGAKASIAVGTLGAVSEAFKK